MIKSKKLLSRRYAASQRKHESQTGPRQESVDACPICGCKTAELIAEIDREGYPCDTVICHQCDFVFNDTKIADPNAFYATTWAEERWRDPYASFKMRTSLDSFSWRRHNFILSETNGFFSERRTVIELGCGDGCNLFPFHLTGHEVIGLDYNKRFLEPGLKAGMRLIEISNGLPPDLPRADMVMIVHALEHVKDLDTFINQVFEFIAEDGLIYIEVPGIRGFNRINRDRKQVMGVNSSNDFLGYLQYQHNFHFEAAHLKYLWSQYGFEVIYCDEFVRALLTKNNKVAKEVLPSKENSISDYLQDLEADYRSFPNYLRRFLRYISRKVGAF